MKKLIENLKDFENLNVFEKQNVKSEVQELSLVNADIDVTSETVRQLVIEILLEGVANPTKKKEELQAISRQPRLEITGGLQVVLSCGDGHLVMSVEELENLKKFLLNN